ncbi:PAS-domain containing protein [Paracoccus tegillarcae]|uniref:histidine kinase n=1 Tax=Paracoccus tegillarcae TaxID=1529068 RepID=A0A2K9ERQ4_9RHOB|nr:PAS-domain containing protein [Paracoccus tegillarcae]AUH33476.1 hybrid sensor histidine kinase/response regulator [Paracoccus tegillarcae]
MTNHLLDPADPPERQLTKLGAICKALMNRVEAQTDADGAAYAQFERAVVLEEEVRRRTSELETALRLLNESNERLSDANTQIERERRDVESALETVQEGFALFDQDDQLKLFNTRFCWGLRDIRERLQLGMGFADYIRLASESAHLRLSEGTSRDDWRRARMGSHGQPHANLTIGLTGDHWLQISEHRTANGGTAIIQTDVTDLIRAERAARENLLDNQSQVISAALDHLAQGVAVFDRDARLVLWNSQFRILTRLPPSAFRIGSDFERVVEQLQQLFVMPDTATRNRISDWVRDQRLRTAPVFLELPGRQGGTLETFMQNLPDDGFIISMTDITRERESLADLERVNQSLEQRVRIRTAELQQALRGAERANAAKNRFVAAASHDLLQPLSAAKLYLTGAKEGPHGDTIAKAEQALQNVEDIIEALLDISRLDSEEEPLDRYPFPLIDILRPVASALAPLAEAKGLDLRILPSNVHVVSDAAFLRRILQNLISNAIRYTETGRVLIGTRRRGSTVRLEVWDTGPGIREADQRVIFEEFRRLNRRASASEGMGLGLAIVERACARLDHPLELQSVQGRGSVFKVTVPLAGSQPAGYASTTPHPIADGEELILPDDGLIVLLVDDDDQLREALVALLDGWGVSVLQAGSYAEALTLLDEAGIVPDALLLDYQLGEGETGLDLAREIEARYGRRPGRIISADRSPALVEACLAEGLALLQKPLDMAQLRGFLAAVVPSGG